MADTEKQLLEYFSRLDAEHQQTLLEFAEFLAARYPQTIPGGPLPAPEPIPRPELESVVAAIKRLSASYFMLDKPELLNETSLLMSQHVLQGREARQVIDELEALFERNYQQLLNKNNDTTNS